MCPIYSRRRTERADLLRYVDIALSHIHSVICVARARVAQKRFAQASQATTLDAASDAESGPVPRAGRRGG